MPAGRFLIVGLAVKARDPATVVVVGRTQRVVVGDPPVQDLDPSIQLLFNDGTQRAQRRLCGLAEADS